MGNESLHRAINLKIHRSTFRRMGAGVLSSLALRDSVILEGFDNSGKISIIPTEPGSQAMILDLGEPGMRSSISEIHAMAKDHFLISGFSEGLHFVSKVNVKTGSVIGRLEYSLPRVSAAKVFPISSSEFVLI